MRRKDREVTDKIEIEKIIMQCKTCHVAMIDGDIPYIVPLSFGYKFIMNDCVLIEYTIYMDAFS